MSMTFIFAWIPVLFLVVAISALEQNGNIRFLGHVPQPELVGLLQRARAFVFAAEEDFGILPVEAQAPI